MNKNFKLKRNVYVILAAIVLLALAVEITHSQFVLQFSRNQVWDEDLRQPPAPEGAMVNLPPEGPPYCVVYDAGSDYSVRVKNNAARVLQYMKKPLQTVNVLAEPLQIEACEAVIIAVPQLGMIHSSIELTNYVEEGGNLFLAVRTVQDDDFYQVYRKLGILASGEAVDSQGIVLKSNILIGEDGLAIQDSFMTNTVNSVELGDECHILAETGKGVPLLWKKDYGGGTFVVFNGTMLQEKTNRGLIAGAISMLEPDFIYPIFDLKLFYIDDFPAPIRKGNDPAIFNAYHRDIPRFYRDIWWPDMLKAAKKYGLKYTTMIIQSYNDRVDPPFASPLDEDRGNLISYGREVIKSGGELGVHGYNHQSLQTSALIADNYGYKRWDNSESMSESVAEVLHYMNKAFPQYEAMSYVPPSNMLDEEGREALKQAWPTLAVISSLYGEDAERMSYIQEFEIAQDGLLEMPRITSGYRDTPFDRWAEANAVTSLGVFSHFIHPDDLLDPARSQNMTWEQLYKGYLRKMQRVEKTYPWLRATTSAAGAFKMEQALNSSVRWLREPGEIQGVIGNFRGEMYFILRTEHPLAKLSHCRAEQIDQGTYLIEALDENFSIGLGD